MSWRIPIDRRRFLKQAAGGVLLTLPSPFAEPAGAATTPLNPVFRVTDIPDDPFLSAANSNYHVGVDTLLRLMGTNGLKFYRSSRENVLCGATGMLAVDDVVLIKVNAQWKYRGCTNSDLVRGVVQRILNHPDGFKGEVVIIENGQGRGSLNCDTSANYADAEVHANANNETHSFLFLVNEVFKDPRVTSYLLDPIRKNFIEPGDHQTDGYRKRDIVSFPCFTTPGGRRVELRRGVWRGDHFTKNLKLINIPVLKQHGGSEITASLKHLYGVLSMADGNGPYRHYEGLGHTCGTMVASIKAPVLNIIDAVWVSYASLKGYPEDTVFQANQIMASQDPVALDHLAAEQIMYPIDHNPNHPPSTPNIDRWLTDARNVINGSGGLYDAAGGILIDRVTKNKQEMAIYRKKCRLF